MKIIIDAMGGDNAPFEIVKGACLASEKYKSKLVLVGDKPKIEACMKQLDADSRIIDIVHTDVQITMEDDPLTVVRAKGFLYDYRTESLKGRRRRVCFGRKYGSASCRLVPHNPHD